MNPAAANVYSPRRLWVFRSAPYTLLLPFIGCASESSSESTDLIYHLEQVPGDSRPTAVLVGAGDISGCSWWEHEIEEPRDLGRIGEKILGLETYADERTAELLDRIPGTVFTVGDHVYPNGTPQQYADCYDPTWGRHKERTRPAPGNHDYYTQDAIGYFQYFGKLAGDPGKGYYSYELGSWHIVVLNSYLESHAESPQGRWLRSELAARADLCTLAYWHKPRFSSGRHGSDPAIEPLWEILYTAGVDVVVNGHDHHYERFARQTPEGDIDSKHGIRQFVVGTGGAPLRSFTARIMNSDAVNDQVNGVLKLMLDTGRYQWEFVPVEGETFSDSGEDHCHPSPTLGVATNI
jgi:acid phosphatase type 7